MSTRRRRLVGYGLTFVLAGCGAGGGTPGPLPSATATVTAPSATTASSIQPTNGPPATEITSVTDITLQPGLYYIDPVVSDPGSVRVFFTIAASGWSPFLGAFKPWEAGGTSGRVGIGVVDVQNLVVDGCLDHRHQDPPIGPGVAALATALARLRPFRVSDPSTDIAMDSHPGKHLALTLSDVEFVREADGDVVFTDCTNGEIWSWVAPPLSDAFYGYQPGDIEEFWLLDVAGTRLVVETLQSADSPPDVINELRAILESIRIER